MGHNDKPLFEVITKEGHTFKLWLDGRTEGFPGGHCLVNRALPLVYKLQSVGVTAETARERDTKMYGALSFLEGPLRESIKDQQSAWFRGAGLPPQNITVTWNTGIDTAQQLLTEIERLSVRVQDGTDAYMAKEGK